MFALVSLGPEPQSVGLKCDRGLAADVRGRYAAIAPGYQLNKRHWNAVALDGSVPDEDMLELVDHSYDLVLAGLAGSGSLPQANFASIFRASVALVNFGFKRIKNSLREIETVIAHASVRFYCPLVPMSSSAPAHGPWRHIEFMGYLIARLEERLQGL